MDIKVNYTALKSENWICVNGGFSQSQLHKYVTVCKVDQQVGTKMESIPMSIQWTSRTVKNSMHFLLIGCIWMALRLYAHWIDLEQFVCNIEELVKNFSDKWVVAKEFRSCEI